MFDNHVKGFDIFIKEWLPTLVLMSGNISTDYNDDRYKISFSNFKFVRSDLNASDCYLYNETYYGSVYVDVLETKFSTGELKNYEKVSEKVTPNFLICHVPIMLLSQVCNLSRGIGIHKESEDIFGGIFVCNGKKRVIPMKKTLINNFPYFRTQKKSGKKFRFVHFRSTHFRSPWRSTSTLELCYDVGRKQRAQSLYNIFVRFPFVSTTIPLQVLSLAFNWDTEEFIQRTRDMFHYCWEPSFDKYIVTFRNSSNGCMNRDDALNFINKIHDKKEGSVAAVNALKIQILPHLNEMSDIDYSKGNFLAYLFGLLILFLEKKVEPTDRDICANSRMESSSFNLALLYRMRLASSLKKEAVKIMRSALGRSDGYDIKTVLNPARLSKQIISAIATGDWTEKKKGVSTQFINSNMLGDISQLTKTSSLKGEGKHLGPRMLRTDAYGYIAAAATPEGEQCGLVDPIASTAILTVGHDNIVTMLLLITRFGDNYMVDPEFKQEYTLFDSRGRPRGYIRNIDQALKVFLKLRRSCSIGIHTSYSRNDTLREFRIWCEPGRLMRPLIISECLG